MCGQLATTPDTKRQDVQSICMTHQIDIEFIELIKLSSVLCVRPTHKSQAQNGVFVCVRVMQCNVVAGLEKKFLNLILITIILY